MRSTECPAESPTAQGLILATASLLRLEDGGLARELYLQLAEDAASFEELSRRHCDDHPQRQGGQWGPRSLSGLPPALAELLRTTPVGQLRGPERIGPEDWVVLRLESFNGSRLDDPDIPARLLQLEGEAWLAERIEAWLRRQADPAAASPIDQQPADAAQPANGQI